MSKKNDLINCEFEDPAEFEPNTVILIGNGAVENGNEPLKRALLSLEDYQSHYLCKSEIRYKLYGPNLSTILAAYAYNARSYKYDLLKCIQDGKFNGQWRECASIFFEMFNKFRAEIGAKFTVSKSDKEIKLHTFPISEILDGKNSFAVISTNWDELLYDDDLYSKNLISLHGRASIPDSLILPMEATIDDYIVDVFLDRNNFKSDPEEKKAIEMAFRSKETREKHDSAHSIAQKWLLHANKIVFWGTAFNAYDAELMTIIPQSGPDPRFEKKLIIINPDYEARNRIGTFIGTNPTHRSDYDPKSKKWIRKEQNAFNSLLEF